MEKYPAYRHTEQSDERLFERVQELQDIDQEWQSAERRHQIKLEMACIVMEQMARYAETHLNDNELEGAIA